MELELVIFSLLENKNKKIKLYVTNWKLIKDSIFSYVTTSACRTLTLEVSEQGT